MTDIGLRNDVPFTVRVEFLSDWACGTGASRHGAVDREVHRDHDGFPMLRGKTLGAMFRDAAETVAAGLDGGPGGTWHRWIDLTFGSQRSVDEDGGAISAAVGVGHGRPQPAALRARPLRLPAPVRAAIATLDGPSRRLVREAMVRLRPGVQVDPETGTAQDEMFRLEEWAAAGLTVEAQWRLTIPRLTPGATVPWEAELLLLAAARMVEAVGGRRRRGAGRCRVTVEAGGAGGADRLEHLLDRVDAARTPHQALAVDEVTGPAEALGHRSAEPLRHCYDLRITAQTPLLLPRGVIGNTVRTERYVPGTMLLPMVARALGSRATELVTGSRVVVTDATIEIGGQRSVPLPRALTAEPGAELSPMVNLLRIGPDDERRLRSDDRFCVPADGGVRIGEPSLEAWAHAVVDDQPQRPNERSGGMFVYEAVAAGTVLRAQVWLPDGVPLAPERLAGERSIGRSKKDDYGQVQIEVVDAEPAVLPAAERSGELVVWLLSDLLLRGAAGEPAAEVSALAVTLGEALGVTLSLPDPGQEEGRTSSVLVTTCRRESWQTRWCLPRPSLTGLAGGSVIRFTMTGQPAPSAYERVRACGLGERTAEGFGRLALQPPLLTNESVPVLPSQEQVTTTTPEPGESDLGVVTELMIRGWRRELYRCAIAGARDDGLRKKLVPPNATAAQLGTLRTLADRLATDGDPAPALGWVEGTRAVPRRQAAWEGSRLDRLQRLFSGADDELWGLLGASPPGEVAGQLYRPALSWLLSEMARTQSNAPPDDSAVRYSPNEQEVAV